MVENDTELIRDYNLSLVQPPIKFEQRRWWKYELEGVEVGRISGFWDLAQEPKLFIIIPNNPTLHTARLQDVLEQEGQNIKLTGREQEVEYVFNDLLKHYRKGWLLGTKVVDFFGVVYKVLDQETKMLMYVPKEDVKIKKKIEEVKKEKKKLSVLKLFKFWNKDTYNKSLPKYNKKGN